MTIIIETDWFKYSGPITEKTEKIINNLLKIDEDERAAENIKSWFSRHRGHRPDENK